MVEILSDKRTIRVPALAWLYILVIADACDWQRQYAKVLDTKLWMKRMKGKEQVDMDNHFVSYSEAKSMVNALRLISFEDIEAVTDDLADMAANKIAKLEDMPSRNEIRDGMIYHFKAFTDFVETFGPFIVSPVDPDSESSDVD